MAFSRARVRTSWLVLTVLWTVVMPRAALAQEDELTLDDLLEGAREWVQEHVDDRVAAQVDQLDLTSLDPALREIQRRLQGEYVIDLAGLRESATNLVAALEETAETQPYARWLRARLDYFEVAEEFRLTHPRPPTEPGEPPAPMPTPEPTLERKAWRKRLADRPWPKEAAPYVTRLKPVFAAQQLPPELVWLAEVESSFDPKARSPVGAAGLFQLMPATAKAHGLSLAPKDQRLDPERNAEAAAKYLKYLYPRFKDWRLTLAAYNAGEGRLQKLLKQYKVSTFDGVAPHLPAETQMYVPKLEAVLLEREGVELTSLRGPGD
jgi:membrane-bound lytic murein transglycosylase D